MKWIKIKSHGPFIDEEDKSPPYGEKVLIVSEFPLMGLDKTLKTLLTAKYCCTQGWIYDDNSSARKIETITHWMPLPEGPKCGD